MAARATVRVELEFLTITCCQVGCGIAFAIPEWWEQKRREDHAWWYCPNGHAQHFSGRTADQERVARLEEELRQAKQAHEWEHERRVRAQNDAMDLANQNRTLKGVVTKARKRAAAGVCGFCNRTFQNVTHHVASRHPSEGHPKAVGVDALAAKRGSAE